MAMRTLLSLVIMLLSMVGFAQDNLRVASYNIRMNSPNDGINIWENRKAWLTHSIRFFELDIVGTQEVTFSQLKDMQEELWDYQSIGVGRAGGTAGEYSAIFYRKDRFEELQSDTFWLSDTPHKIGSKGWDAALPRIVTWAKFKDKTNSRIFYFFNTHFDHRGKHARAQSAGLISRKISQIAGDSPVVLTGDFNTRPDSEPHKKLLLAGLKDVFLSVPDSNKYTRGYTHNSWNVTGQGDYGRIDYVFFKGSELAPIKYHVLDGQRGELFISDHFPVIAELLWKDKP